MAGLLSPDAGPRRLGRLEGMAMAGLYVLALAIRWSLRDATPYTAEASHYFAARHLWMPTDQIRSVFDDVPPDDFTWFFWQRPLLSILYAPAAHLGFEAYRSVHVAVASLIPPLAAWLMLRLGAPRRYAWPAAAILAVHPGLLAWTTLLLPDATVCVLVLGAMVAAQAQRPNLTAALLLAAEWVKETAFVATAALLVLALLGDLDGRPGLRGDAGRLRFTAGPLTWRLAIVLPLAFLPLLVSMHLAHAAFPGFRTGGTWQDLVERDFLLIWLAPIALGALAWRPTRRLALACLAWPAFFLLYHALTGKAVEAWYHVVPATLSLVLVAVTLGRLDRDRAATQRPWVPAVACLVLAGLAVQVAVPAGASANAAVATPLSGHGQWDFDEAYAYERTRDRDLQQAIDLIPAEARATVLALDMDWSLVHHPVASVAQRVDKDYTQGVPMDEAALRWWAHTIESRVNASLVREGQTPLNHAIRVAYQGSGCAPSVGAYVVIVASKCQGHADALVAAYAAETRPVGPRD